MPIYEYRCTKGHTFDVMQRFSDDPLDTCEICGAPAQRVLHAPAVHFKGSGFYNTDYGTRKRSREKEREGAANGSSGSDGSSLDSSDSSKSGETSKSGADSSSKGSDSSSKSSDSAGKSKAKTAD